MKGEIEMESVTLQYDW